MKTGMVKWRAIFNPRNSTCGSAKIGTLNRWSWWTDTWREIIGGKSIYIHAESKAGDGTVHRVHPRPLPGYRCTRIGMRRRGPRYDPCWLYDRSEK